MVVVQDNLVNRELFLRQRCHLVPGMVYLGAVLGEWTCLQTLLRGSWYVMVPEDIIAPVVSACREVCMAYPRCQGSLSLLAVLPTKALVAVARNEDFQTKVLKCPKVTDESGHPDQPNSEGLVLYYLTKVLFRLWEVPELAVKYWPDCLQNAFSATKLSEGLKDKSRTGIAWLQLFNTLGDMVSSKALAVTAVGDGQKWQGIVTAALKAASTTLMCSSNKIAGERHLDQTDFGDVSLPREHHVCAVL